MQGVGRRLAAHGLRIASIWHPGLPPSVRAGHPERSRGVIGAGLAPAHACADERMYLRHHGRVTGQDIHSYSDGPDGLTWLQGWYVTQCDGEWEHEYGMSIETLDNPGWFLKVDLQATAMDGRAFPPHEVHRSEHDWLIARVVDSRFEVACGPLNLSEAIHQFRIWIADVDQDRS